MRNVHLKIIAIMLAFTGSINAQLNVKFVDERVSPLSVKISDISHDGRFVLFYDSLHIFIYDIIAEDYKAILRMHSGNEVRFVPLSFYETIDRIIVEKWLGPVKSGWGEITLNYRDRTDAAVHDMPMAAIASNARQYDLRVFPNLIVIEQYQGDTLSGLTVLDTKSKTRIGKINERTENFNTAFEDCEAFRRYDYLVNTLTGDFILIEEYFKRGNLRLNVTTFKNENNSWTEATSNTIDTDHDITPCAQPKREYYLSEDGQSLFGFIRDSVNHQQTELFVVNLDSDDKKVSILYDPDNLLNDKDTVYALIRKLSLSSRRKKQHTRSYKSQTSGIDFESAFLDDSLQIQQPDGSLARITDNKVLSSGMIARKANIFQSKTSGGKDSIYYLDYRTGLISAFPLEKANVATAVIQNYDSYKKIKGTSFDVVNLPDNLKNNDVQTDCLRRYRGKYEGIHVTTDSTEADSLAMNCRNNALYVFRREKVYKIDINQLIKQIGTYSNQSVADSVIRKIKNIYLKRLTPPLAHFKMAMTDSTWFFFVYNIQLKQLQAHYKFNQKFPPALWSKVGSNDSVYFFMDLKYRPSSLAPGSKKYDFTVLLLKYNINKGLISHADSIIVLNKAMKNENWKNMSYDYYHDISLISIQVPFKDGILLYDLKNRKTICKLDNNTGTTMAYEDLTPILDWFREKSFKNQCVNLRLISRVINNSRESSNQFLFANAPANRITMLSGHSLREVVYDNTGKGRKTKDISVEGKLWNYDFSRNFMILSTGPETYWLYNISPLSPLLKIHFDRTKVRFTSSVGKEFTEIYTINSKGDSYLHPQFNRPDIILSKLGCSDTRLKYIYREIVKLRNARLDSTLNKLTIDNIPHVEIKNHQDLLKIYQNQVNPSITFAATCVACTPTRYNIWINGVPLHGEDGLTMTGKSVSERISLSEGRNEIEFSVQNEFNLWAPKTRYVCHYLPQTPRAKRKVYFVGIGMSEYADSTRRLQSSDKDIRAFNEILSTRYQDDFILIDTLINIKNLKQRFRDLKDSLLKTNINDKVILMLSGHGLLSSDKLQWHFAAYETNFSKPDSTVAITFKDINYLMDGIPARNRFIIVDACHAGQSFFQYGKNAAVKNLNDNVRGDDSPSQQFPYTILQGFSTFEPAEKFTPLDYEAFKIMTEFFPDFIQNGSTIITASRGEQTAKEDKDNGMFTKALLEVLQQAKHGTLTINQLIEEVNAKFKFSKDPTQKPSLKCYNQSLNWLIW
jgi:hypothetical protein